MNYNKNQKKYRLLDSMGEIDEEIIEKASPSKKRVRLNKKRVIILSIAAALLLSLSLWLFIPLNYDVKVPNLKKYEDSEYYDLIKAIATYNATQKIVATNRPYNNFEKILDSLSSFGAKSEDGTKGYIGGDNINAVPEAVSPSYGDGGSNSLVGSVDSSNGSYVEATDNQVEGVIEGDLIKRSDKYIFYLYQNILKVFTIAGDDSQKVAEYELSTQKHSNCEMYLSEDCNTVTVISRKYSNNGLTVISAVDVSDISNIHLKSSVEISGKYLSSRLVDGNLMVFTNFYLNSDRNFSDEKSFVPSITHNGKCELVAPDDIIFPEELSNLSYTQVSIFDGELETVDSGAFLSYSSNVYVSKDNIFASRSYQSTLENDKNSYSKIQKTEISAMSYSGEALEPIGAAEVSGRVLDQYSFDEKDGILRVVTTTEEWLYTKNINGHDSCIRQPINASLFCIDLDSFDVVASVEKFAPDGESVQSVRFEGDNAYVCTAIQRTDPVFFFDLSDIENITYVKTKDIDGFSTSLIDIGEGLLVGIGEGASSGFKLEVYRRQGDEVVSVDKFEIQRSYYANNYKSYFIDRDKDLIGLGIVVYESENGKWQGNSKYMLFEFKNGMITVKLSENLGGEPYQQRATLEGDYFYMLGENDFIVKKIY